MVAALFPLTMHRPHPVASTPATATVAAHATESDEQLMADIDQKLSADVPAPMEPLADPTDGISTTSSTSEQRKN